MAQAFGNPLGPFYPLGRITVTTPGTPVPLNINVPTTTAFGTTTSPAPVVAHNFTITSLAANPGYTYIVYASGSKNLPNSILLMLPPGGSPFMFTMYNNTLQPNEWAVDADTAGNALQISCVIG